MSMRIRSIMESLMDEEDCLDAKDEDAIAIAQGVTGVVNTEIILEGRHIIR